MISLVVFVFFNDDEYNFKFFKDFFFKFHLCFNIKNNYNLFFLLKKKHDENWFEVVTATNIC